MYKVLPLDKYLRVVSCGYFVIYKLGLGPLFQIYEYPRFLKKLLRKGDVIIDIGANLGYYSWFFSRIAGKTGKVYAIEPVVPIFKVLEHNLRHCENVEAYNYALGEKDCDVVMGNDSIKGHDHFATGQNFVLDADTTGRTSAENEFSAHMRRGSQLFADIEQLDMIKCDSEGYEGVVIPEMESVIDKHMPLVLLESSGHNRVMLTSFFAAKGYRAYILENGAMRPAYETDNKDIIFVPPGRFEKLQRLIVK